MRIPCIIVLPLSPSTPAAAQDYALHPDSSHLGEGLRTGKCSIREWFGPDRCAPTADLTGTRALLNGWRSEIGAAERSVCPPHADQIVVRLPLHRMADSCRTALPESMDGQVRSSDVLKGALGQRSAPQ